MMQSFFITSSGTHIGKTLVTAALCWQLRERGKKVMAMKPLITGYDTNDAQSDTALILQSCELPYTQAMVEAISPWRYAAPLAPNMAAAKEKKPQVELEELCSFCQGGGGDYTVVEGIGGVMSPINDRHTVLDWMEALSWPVILVAGSYLGSISHALTAWEALRARRIAVKAVVVSESASGDVPLPDTASTLEKFLLGKVPVVTIPRLAASGELWKQVPPMSFI